jgi:hypothetical protein
LEILWNAVENAEMIDFIGSIDLEDYEEYFDKESQNIEQFYGLLTPPKKRMEIKGPKINEFVNYFTT